MIVQVRAFSRVLSDRCAGPASLQRTRMTLSIRADAALLMELQSQGSVRQ